jgi:hypothetical protein
MRAVPLIAQLLMMEVLTLFEELLSILDVVLVFLLFFLFGTLGGGGLGELDVVFYDLVGEDDSLVGAADPGGLGFDLD